MSGRRLIPYPVQTDWDDDRLHHRDLAELDEQQIWAERVLLTRLLARIIFYGFRERLISLNDPRQAPFPVSAWIGDRLRRLDDELTRRRRGRVA